jgi:hypothetical protein
MLKTCLPQLASFSIEYSVISLIYFDHRFWIHLVTSKRRNKLNWRLLSSSYNLPSAALLRLQLQLLLVESSNSAYYSRSLLFSTITLTEPRLATHSDTLSCCCCSCLISQPLADVANLVPLIQKEQSHNIIINIIIIKIIIINIIINIILFICLFFLYFFFAFSNIISKMAQLFRFLYMDDRHRSEVFTFMIPSSFILDADTELRSRDFTSSNQKWSLSFMKNNGQLSPMLTLKSVYEGMSVNADYGITLINREHFTRNESFVEKNAKFTYENSSLGRKSFVSIEALCTLDFMDERGNIQCELEIKNVNTTYAYDAQVPVTPSYTRHPSELKYTSSSFAFGNYEWNICIQPKLDSMGGISCLKFYMCRLSSLDHLCRISYRYKLINGAFVHDSGIIEQYSDMNGASNSYRMDKIRELLQLTGKFVMRVELIKINSVFPIILYPLSHVPQPVHFYDRDRQAWMMESCIEDNCFILRLFYTDINNIPSGYVRVLSFNISIRHQQNGSSVYVFKKPVIKYYYKRESDDGLEITTVIDINEVNFYFFLDSTSID